MSRFFPEKYLGEIIWDVEVPPENRSAFVQYKEYPGIEFHGSNFKNVNKRLIEFIRRSWPVKNTEAEFEKERSFRHKFNERMRRQRLKQGCLALHSLLPQGTKSDANSVIQTATREIQRLREHGHVLQKIKHEIEAASLIEADVEGAKIQLKVLNPKFGFDSIIGTLKCL